MKKNEVRIFVYADWDSSSDARPMGILTAQRVRGKEVFSFEYNESWLADNPNVLFVDPNLGFYKGKQYLPEEKNNFGLFTDSSPDRWGRMLMRRKEAWLAILENRIERTLVESDYLLGVYDGHRMGALRFKTNQEGEFMHHEKNMATPPWTSLHELQNASLQLEKDDAVDDPQYSKWLNVLIDPGSSLGGARPKASVVDDNGHLWIAKFPSIHDEKNVGAWELVVNELANECGIQVSEARTKKFSGRYHTFLTKRFDRTDNKKRIHFASAMTLLGCNDGTDHHDGASYLDLAGFILQYSADAKADLEQLWCRTLFNVLVSNTDDHLRNHGFILTTHGWRLSPAYDMNPNEMGNGLTLNISENSNEQNISLVLSTAHFYQLKKDIAAKILERMQEKISNWKTHARNAGISSSEMERMKRAFRLS